MDEETQERVEANMLAGLRMVARFGAREHRCHDCAFRRDSPETIDSRISYPSQLGTLLEDLDYALAGEADLRTAFVCHQGMPTGPKGPPDYQPPRDEDGVPVGFPLCAGWVREFDRRVAAFNAASD